MRNPAYENALNKQGVAYTYVENFLVADINIEKGRRNNARLEQPLDEELAKQYEVARKNGDPFPPVVLSQPKKTQKATPIDGNHRLWGITKLGLQHTDAYVVTTDDQQVVDRIAWTINNHVNGRRNTPQETLQHAVTFVRKYGMEPKQAATEFGIAYWAVKKAVRIAELKDVLHERNVKITPTLTDEKIYDLAAVQPLGDNLFATAAATVARCGMTSEDIDELNKDVKKAKTVEEKTTVIRSFGKSQRAQQRRAETKNGTVKTLSLTPRDKLVRVLKELDNLFEKYEHTALRPVGLGYKDAHGIAGSVADNLILLFGLGARPAKEKSNGASKEGV